MAYFPQLNIRTSYNFLESLISVDEYIKFAKENHFNILFYSEHKTMYGVAEFIKKCKENNLKPVIGVAIDFSDGSVVIVYAKNDLGYKTLNYLSSYLNDGFNHDEVEIKEYLISNLTNDNVVVTNSYDENFVFNLKGKTDLYTEEETNINLDRISFFKENEKELFRILKSIKTTRKIHEIENFEIQEFYPLNDSNSLIEEIANKVSFDLFKETNKNFIAKFQTPNNVPSDKYLEHLCNLSLNKFFTKVKKVQVDSKYVQRLNYELEIINSMGFADYFLVVSDYINYAKKQNILVGPGRGSAAGSLVAFLLRITDIDPIVYDLVFERFLNPERITMPDIDVDFEDERREEVLEYLFEKYGKYNVATIVTYQTIGVKSAIRDVARAMDINLEIVDKMTKSIGAKNLSNLSEAIANSQILNLYSKDSEYDLFFKMVEKIIGLPRQTGTHAAGLVLSNDDLRNHVPIKIGSTGFNQIQFDMNYLEPLGLIKMDLLGLRNLTTLKEILNKVNKERKEIKLSEISLTDQKTYTSLNLGNTSGIFQLESDGMTNTVKQIQVNSIDDISICSALFRPGPQEMIPKYVINKKNNQIPLIHESLKDILVPTYGIIVYQEQVLQILGRVANFSLAKADLVRRAMGKKDKQYMDQVEQEFLQNAVTNGYELKVATRIWRWIEKFASYGFNKSHSIAYAYISYWLAYFKANYPEQFYSSLLNGVIGSASKTTVYLKELNQYGIKINKPSVKTMALQYVSGNKTLELPLILIKDIGIEFVKNLRLAYEADQELFSNLYYFVNKMDKRGLNRTTFLSLAKAGALDLFGMDISILIDNIDFIFKMASNIDTININQIAPLTSEIEITDQQLSEFEMEVYGFYLSEHPLTKIKNEYSIFKPTDINKLSFSNSSINNIIGIVSSIRVIKDKNKNDMAFITMSDDTGELDVTVFASSYEKYQGDILINKTLVLEIRTEMYDNSIKGILNKILKIIK